ncbi:MAG: DUF4065 domain-containing protein [Campylobacter sp.]|nr:DUF4065 domain-containing protein [Campylobacter sp.]
MKALDLAKYVILISYQTGYPVSNLQLQKILYFANMFYIKKNNKSLIEEHFQAWQFGPVVENVYREYFSNGSNPIYPTTDLLADANFKDGIEKQFKNPIEMKRLILNLAQMNAWELVRISHLNDGAWKKTFDEQNPYLRAEIDEKLIREEMELRFK